MQNEDITLLIAHLEGTDLVLFHLFSLQPAMLLRLEDCHTIILLIIFVLFALLNLADVASELSVETLFDLITNFDDFAIFDDTFR